MRDCVEEAGVSDAGYEKNKALGVAAALVLTALAVSQPAHATSSPIEHIVLIEQENHSFDNVLADFCVVDHRCDGATSGRISSGGIVPLRTATDVVPSMAHYAAAQTTAVDGGRMDGFNLIFGCDSTSGFACYSRYLPAQIPGVASLARAYALSDRTFSPGAQSFGAHITAVAGTLDGFTGDNPESPIASVIGWGCDSGLDAPWRSLEGVIEVPACVPRPNGTGPYRPSPVKYVPTIMDRMRDAGIPWKIYGSLAGGPGYVWSICPTFTTCIYGPQGLTPHDRFYADAAAGTLPALSIITPTPSESQHNLNSMATGDNYLAGLVNAVRNGPDWTSTAIFITWDDCGCFYDHVPPPAGFGIRVPMLIVSPYARAGYTDHNVASYASPLAYIEHTFGLASLGGADATAYDYRQSFNYSQVPLRAAAQTNPSAPPPVDQPNAPEDAT